MNKSIVLSLLLISTTEMLSQVVLTSANNPTPGNMQMSVDCDTTGVTEGNAGANQTWNFTSLTRQDSSVLTWVPSSLTPYSTQFPTSNIASTNDNSNYNYFTTSSANLLVNGTAGPVLAIPNTDPELFLQYPFSYNSTFTDNFSANYIAGGSPVTRTGTIVVTGDAWGTITLPFGSFPNALRVKYLVSTRDSSDPGFPIVIGTNVTSYVWFVPGRKFPVFEIIYTSATFNGVPQSSSKLVNFDAGNTSTGVTPVIANVPAGFSLSQNYPNPFNPTTAIRYEISVSSFVTLKVFSMLGEEVATLVDGVRSPGSYVAEFNALDLPSGVYLYRFRAGGFTETKRLILLQ